MDYLRQLSIQLSGKIHSQRLFDINFQLESSRKLIVKNYKGYKLEIDEFGKIFFIRIRVYSNYNLSINNPNKLSSIDQQIDIEQAPYKIYIFKESYSSFIKGSRYNPFVDKEFQAFWSFFIIKIKDLILTDDETVSIRENYFGLSLHSNRNLVAIIDSITGLADCYKMLFKQSDSKKIQTKNVPNNLRQLLPLLKKWGISDDNEREQLIADTSEKEKKKLVNTVFPFMSEINEFLDSFEDRPLSEEAILIGNLAELVSELNLDYQHGAEMPGNGNR